MWMTERAASTQCESDCEFGGGLGRGNEGLGGRKLRCRVIKIEKYEFDSTAERSWTGRSAEGSLYLDGFEMSTHSLSHVWPVMRRWTDNFIG